MPTTRPLRVLLADDDEEESRALAAILTATRLAEVVGSARDGLDAVDLYAALQPDIVFMDVVMPRCDGLEATKRIRALDPDARIVALTGAEDYRVLALCLAAGAKGCLRKGPDTIRIAPVMLALAWLPRPDLTSGG